MKQFFLFLSITMCVNSFATVRTVSNNPNTIAQYSTVQSAVDASVPGDTIYVHGSPNPYDACTINNKRLTILGSGWAPDKLNFVYKASVGMITFSGAGSDNSEIQGLHLNNGASFTSGTTSNVKFLRNEIQGNVSFLQNSITYSGIVFQGNFFNTGTINGTNGSTFTNILVQNNIFLGSNLGTANVYSLTNSSNVLFDHNLWYTAAVSSTVCFSNDCRNLLLTNNIFVERNAASSTSFCTFNNNITFNAGVNNPWAVNNNSNAGGNVENQDPQMGDQVSVNNGVANPLLNFTITAGPANNGGSDGKDMGLLYDATGSLNWTNSRTSRIPYIYSMNVTNPTISAGGTLNVQVEARRAN